MYGGKDMRMKPPRLVLDTNVVLDWLVFRDPAVAAIASAIEQQRVRWVVCTSMRDEFARTLVYPQLARWQPDMAGSLAVFDRHASIHREPATWPSLRCVDPDDQVFIDLAVEAGCTHLVSHDRALLRLKRGAGRLGLQVIQPDEWRAV
jgi:putative PIN family toxin of toxin-antitoxin system